MQVPLFSLELPVTLAYWRDIFKRNSSVETSCILMQIPLSHLKPNFFSFFPILFLSFSRQKENIFDDLSFHETNSLEELHMYIYITIYIHTQYTQRWVFSLFKLSFFFLHLYSIFFLKCSRFYPKPLQLQTSFHHNESGSIFYRKRAEYCKFIQERATNPKQGEHL